MTVRFLQIHTLTSYPGVLLNRDDVGLAKRLSFGGASRTRISSQCLKRHWRSFDGDGSFNELGIESSVRSRETFDRLVLKPLVADGLDPETTRQATEAVMSVVLGESAKARAAKEDVAKKDESAGKLLTGQVTVLGRPEIEYLREEVRAICQHAASKDKVKATAKERLTKERRENLEALRHAAGLDAALFGRMVTSDILSRGDAAVHVAHAFTVHGEEAENDYFSAVDDLTRSDEELGAGHINSTELTSGLYYGYVVIDLPLLVSNLEGCEQAMWLEADRSLAADVVERIVRIIATVSPGAKLGSTAPYSYAHMVLAEAGSAQPRTLANAFIKPVRASGDLINETYKALADYLIALDGMYANGLERRFAAIDPTGCLAKALGGLQPISLEGVASWAAEAVRSPA